jgi:hypothetical protein
VSTRTCVMGCDARRSRVATFTQQSYDIHVEPSQFVHSLGSRDAVVLAAVTGVGEKTSSPHAPEDARVTGSGRFSSSLLRDKTPNTHN